MVNSSSIPAVRVIKDRVPVLHPLISNDGELVFGVLPDDTAYAKWRATAFDVVSNLSGSGKHNMAYADIRSKLSLIEVVSIHDVALGAK